MTVGQGSPVQTESWKHQVGSSSVDVAFTAFGDANMLVFTDTGSMGTIIRASVDGGPQAGSTYTIQTLLGRRDDELKELLARTLMDISRSKSCSKPLLLSLGLKHLDLDAVKSIVAFTKENIDWKGFGSGAEVPGHCPEKEIEQFRIIILMAARLPILAGDRFVSFPVVTTCSLVDREILNFISIFLGMDPAQFLLHSSREVETLKWVWPGDVLRREFAF